MVRYDFDVIGITYNERKIGYVENSDLIDENSNLNIKYFNSWELIADSTPLIEIFPLLKNEPHRLFVLYGNQVNGIITISDIQKITVRIFLFGLISLLELKMTEIILDSYPDDTWKNILKDNRLQKAEKLFKWQKKNKENLELVDCLEFIDKCTIILQSNKIKEIETPIEDLKHILILSETLRNIIAHSKNFDKEELDIVDLSIQLSKLLNEMSNLVLRRY